MQTIRRNACGLSLLETMLALSIALAMASYAVPAYREYVARSYRQTAIDELHRQVLLRETMMERPPSGRPATSEISVGGRLLYRIESKSAPEGMTGYSIEASPLAMGPQAGDRCGVYVIDAQGRRFNRHVGEARRIDNADHCWSGR